MSSSPTAGPRAGIARGCAAGAIVFVVLLVAQNIIRAAEPSFDASAPSVTDYFLEHRVAVLVPLCLFPLGMVGLLVFAAGLRSLAGDGLARFWADLGGLAVLVIASLFALVNVAEIAITVLARGADPVPTVETLWAVHAGAFGLNLGAIAIALVAFSRVARRMGLIPRWLGMLALPGAGCLFVGAIATVSVAEGGPVLYVGLIGFLVWVLFLGRCAAGLLARPSYGDTGPHSMNTVIHAAFRRDLHRLGTALAGFPAGSRTRADELHRAWRHYAAQLHQHHEGEEEVFFPALARVADVTALLADLQGEHAGMLEALAAADAAMDELHADPSGQRASRAAATIAGLGEVLDAHLAHEERDFEPIAERCANTPEMRAAEREIRKRHRKDSGAFFAWLLDGASPSEEAALRRLVPPPALRTTALIGGHSYRTTIARVWHR